MKNREPTITKNSRFSISKNEEISKCVEKYSYENDSEFIRIGVELLLNYHAHKEKYQDPDQMIQFAKEIDPPAPSPVDVPEQNKRDRPSLSSPASCGAWMTT